MCDEIQLDETPEEPLPTLYKVLLEEEGELVSPMVPVFLRKTYATVAKTGKIKIKTVAQGDAYCHEADARKMLAEWQPYKDHKLQLWAANASKIMPLTKKQWESGVAHCEKLTILERLDIERQESLF